MSVTPKSSWPWVRTLLHSIFDQPDAESVVAQYDRVLDTLADKLPEVAEHLDAARHDLLAFTAVPSRSGAKSGPTTPRSDSTRKSSAVPTSWVSSPIAPPSSASSAPCWPNNMTSGSKAAAASGLMSSLEPALSRRTVKHPTAQQEPTGTPALTA